MRVHPGVNRIRFKGKLGRGWLRDGTYVLITPTKPVRFAIVNGRPTRAVNRLAPSVCRDVSDSAFSLPYVLGQTTLPPTGAGVTDGDGVAVGIEDNAPAVGGAIRKAVDRPTRVLGRTADEVADAVTSLHPAFYVLLAAAILMLATATLPASAVPSPWLGATLARRRAELTFAGTSVLVAVIVAYLIMVGA